jgi:hypothetical protein
MRIPASRRLAIGAVGLILATAGCGTSPAASPSPAPASPSAAVAPSASASAGPAAIVWPAPPDPMALAVQAGLKPQPKEFLTNHVHAHLDVFVDGVPVTVASGIGIKIDDPAVRQFPEPNGSTSYGGIQLCNEPCISPLHTHDISGIIHTESASPVPNTLGEFFIEWGVPLDTSCVSTYCSPATKVAVYIGGQPFSGDPRTIELTDQKVIVIAIGTPPPVIPSTADFSQA